ncbi:hypothetical protein [Bacillus subtilis]|uniref:hypothetical protein n=1 Tax=Bacillus subtilis TaxID=1423 RepID=UPI002DB62CBA|nr:hypothetical protein [Bacillus subtilis]MEC2332500.1 hypothetical protein [Bacillus subtilis]
MFSPHFTSKKSHFLLVFFTNRDTMEVTTKPVVSSPLGNFAGRVFCFSGTLKSGVCLQKRGRRSPNIAFPEIWIGGGSFALSAMNLVVTGVTQAYKVVQV